MNYESKYGTIATIAINMDKLRERVQEWQKEFIPPEPPFVFPAYTREKREEMYTIKSELGLGRKQAIEEWRKRQPKVPDKNNKEYLAKLTAYQRMEYWFKLRNVILMGVMNNGETIEECILSGKKDLGAIPKILKDTDESAKLYHFILGNSELGNYSIVRQIEELGVEWNGMPILEAIKMLPKGNVSSTWVATGLLAAKEMGVFDRFGSMSIVEQSRVIAVYLVDNWTKSLQAKQAKDKADAARNSRNNKPIRN